MNEMELSRRGFLSSLAGLVVYAKTSLGLSPAASASQPTCEVPSWKIGDARWREWLDSQPSKWKRGAVMVVDVAANTVVGFE